MITLDMIVKALDSSIAQIAALDTFAYVATGYRQQVYARVYGTGQIIISSPAHPNPVLRDPQGRFGLASYAEFAVPHGVIPSALAAEMSKSENFNLLIFAAQNSHRDNWDWHSKYKAINENIFNHEIYSGDFYTPENRIITIIDDIAGFFCDMEDSIIECESEDFARRRARDWAESYRDDLIHIDSDDAEYWAAHVWASENISE